VAAFLKLCSPGWTDGGKLKLEVKANNFALKNIKKHKTFIEQQGSQLAGRDITIVIKANAEASVAKQEKRQKDNVLKQEAMSHPLVMRALELFNGRVIDIKVP
jgi:hypothetical protein